MTIATDQHPSWCDLGQCNAESTESIGEHRSAPRRVDPPWTGYPVIDVSLWAESCQPVADAERYPVAELRLTIQDGDRVESVESVTTYELDLSQLRALGAVAAELVARVDRELVAPC